MDTLSTDGAQFDYIGGPPLLLAASSDAAMARAERTAGASGLRVGARLPIHLASERLERQAAASAVWIELDRDCGGAMDELLTQVSRDAASGRYAAVVAATADLLDPLFARLGIDGVEFVIDGSDSERAAALAVATSKARLAPTLSDVAGDQSAERLRQLSDEVNRIASTLAQLSTRQPPLTNAAVLPSSDVPPVSLETVRAVIRARRLRERYFQEELFADPAWDMLLDLLQAEIAQLRVPVSSLCIAAAVPATTALRWLNSLVAKGILIRRSDPRDGRRIFVELSPETSAALRRYFGELGQVSVI